MTLEWLHPGLLLIVGAWVLPLLKGNVKRAAMLVLPAAALIDCFVMRPGTYGVTNFLGQQVVFGRVDRLSLVFSYVFSIMAFIGMLYALHVKDDSQHVAALTYAGSARWCWSSIRHRNLETISRGRLEETIDRQQRLVFAIEH